MHVKKARKYLALFFIATRIRKRTNKVIHFSRDTKNTKLRKRESATNPSSVWCFQIIRAKQLNC